MFRGDVYIDTYSYIRTCRGNGTVCWIHSQPLCGCHSNTVEALHSFVGSFLSRHELCKFLASVRSHLWKSNEQCEHISHETQRRIMMVQDCLIPSKSIPVFRGLYFITNNHKRWRLRQPFAGEGHPLPLAHDILLFLPLSRPKIDVEPPLLWPAKDGYETLSPPLENSSWAILSHISVSWSVCEPNDKKWKRTFKCRNLLSRTTFLQYMQYYNQRNLSKPTIFKYKCLF